MSSAERQSWLLVAVLAALVLLLGWVGWSALQPIPQGSIPATAPGAGYPRSVQLPGGKSVVIPTRPGRIVASNSGAADILSALVDAKRLAAVPVQVETFAASREFWKKHTNIPRFEQYQAEPILAVHPDLVISSAFQNSNTTAIIQARNVPILSFESFETFEGIREAILAIGEAIDERESAAALAKDFSARLQDVRKRVEGRKRPRVLQYSNYGSGFTVGAGGSQEEMLTRAGALNAAAEIGLKGPAPISFEQILKLDPDVFVVCGDAGIESPQAQLILNEPVLSRLRAMKEKRIAVIPTLLFDALSQYVVEGVEVLAKQLHADAFDATKKESVSR